MAARFYREQGKLLRATGRSGVLRLKKQLEKLGKIATRETYDSVDYNVEINVSKNTGKVEIFANKSIVNINDGRRAGAKQPPPQVINDYIDALNIVFKDEKTGKPLPKKQTAFLIGRKIARDGIEPTNIISLVFNRKSFVDLTERRLTRATLEDITTRITTLSKEI
jgi:hypothetical protein